MSFAAGRRVAATSTRSDGGYRGGRCWCACVSLCAFVRLFVRLEMEYMALTQPIAFARARSNLVLRPDGIVMFSVYGRIVPVYREAKNGTYCTPYNFIKY